MFLAEGMRRFLLRPRLPVLDYLAVLRTHPTFKRFTVGELIFAQYTCPIHEPAIGFWTTTDHLIHVLSGKKTWRTPSGSWTAQTGDTVFFKKGAYVIRQNFSADFCVMVFCVPDEFVREVSRGLTGELPPCGAPAGGYEMAMKVDTDPRVDAFLHSMAAYFTDDEEPPAALLRLKLSELIAGILLGRKNQELCAYLRGVAASDLPSVPAIMEANYCHNLSLEAFAKMCHRSLSSFKRKFQECYGVPPGRWLLERRLERAARLLGATGMNVTEVVFECGFESPAHFSRAFREKFGRSPSQHRQAALVQTEAAVRASASAKTERLLYDLATG